MMKAFFYKSSCKGGTSLTFAKSLLAATAAVVLSFSVQAQSDTALDLDALLKQLEEGKFAQSEQNKSREQDFMSQRTEPVSYTHLGAQETSLHLVCRLLLEYCTPRKVNAHLQPSC